MNLFGFEITRKKQLPPIAAQPINTGWGGWWNIISESFPGAWQRNVDIRLDNVLTYSAVFACITLISSDIGKLRLRLVQETEDEIWKEVDVPAFSPVLIKPNHYQTRIQFIEQWLNSKLIHGNTYVLKERDNRRVVRRMYILDPMRVKVLIAPDGDIFYDLGIDYLSGIPDQRIAVPASEIIHDVNAAFYHPLCGLSPIMACGLAAIQGLNIQQNSAKFFQSGSRPGGIITSPMPITDDYAKKLKEHWEHNYSGNNFGKTAVLGDGLKFESVMMTSEAAQMIEQLKWTAENVCTAFHVPPFMIGVGNPPSYNNIEALTQYYYSNCLQTHIESIELLLDEGLGLPEVQGVEYGTEFDLADLLRMDTATKVKSWGDLVQRGIASPDEARAQFSLAPVKGGNTPYLQQQNYSLTALFDRDTGDNPFGTSTPANSNAPQLPAPDGGDGGADSTEGDTIDVAQSMLATLKGELADANYAS